MKNVLSIWDYTPTAGDMEIRNPYLERVLGLVRSMKVNGEPEMNLRGFRDELICEYAFSIPCRAVLERIKSFSPVVEIGAGNGYWAWCLSQCGCDIIAYDSRPPLEEEPLDIFSGNRWFHDEWAPVNEADADKAGSHPDRALLLAWPEPWSLMASMALFAYREAGGKNLIYIGDPESSGDHIFHEALAGYRLLHSEKLQGWPGIGDSLLIYQL